MLLLGEMMKLKGAHTVKIDLRLRCAGGPSFFLAPSCYFIFSALEIPRQAQGSLVRVKWQFRTYVASSRDPYPPGHSHKSWHLLTTHLGRTAKDSWARLGVKF